MRNVQADDGESGRSHSRPRPHGVRYLVLTADDVALLRLLLAALFGCLLCGFLGWRFLGCCLLRRGLLCCLLRCFLHCCHGVSPFVCQRISRYEPSTLNWGVEI